MLWFLIVCIFLEDTMIWFVQMWCPALILAETRLVLVAFYFVVEQEIETAKPYSVGLSLTSTLTYSSAS